MSDPAESDPTESPADKLPAEELDVGWGDDLEQAAAERAADERLLADRPPHWDD